MQPEITMALLHSATAGPPTGTTSFFQAWANFLLGNVATFTQASKDITPNLLRLADRSLRSGRFPVESQADLLYMASAGLTLGRLPMTTSN